MLAHAIVAEGIRNVSAGANPMILKHGLEKAVGSSSKRKKQSRQVKTREQIAEVMDRVDKDGVITGHEVG